MAKRHLHDILIQDAELLQAKFQTFVNKYEDKLQTEDNLDAIDDVWGALNDLEQGLIHIDV